MARVDDFRRYLQGEIVPEISPYSVGDDAAVRKAVELAREPPAEAQLDGLEVGWPVQPAKFPVRYTLNTSGTDAKLGTGRWRGQQVSDMAKRVDGAKYLDWLLSKNPPAEMESLIKRYRTFQGGVPGVKKPVVKQPNRRAPLKIDDDGSPI